MSSPFARSEKAKIKTDNKQKCRSHPNKQKIINITTLDQVTQIKTKLKINAHTQNSRNPKEKQQQQQHELQSEIWAHGPLMSITYTAHKMIGQVQKNVIPLTH